VSKDDHSKPDSSSSSGKKKAPLSLGGGSKAAQGWNVVPSSAPQATPDPDPVEQPNKKENNAGAGPQKEVPTSSVPPSKSAQSPSPPKTKQPAKAKKTIETAKSADDSNSAKQRDRKTVQSKQSSKPTKEIAPEKRTAPPPLPNNRQSDASQQETKRHRKLGNIPRLKKTTAVKSVVQVDESNEPEWISEVKSEVKFETPAWLLSLIVHFALIVLLALFSYVEVRQEPHEVSAVFAEDLGDQLDQELLILDNAEFKIDESTGAIEITEMIEDDPLPNLVLDTAITGTESAKLSDELSPGVELATRGDAAMRRTLLKAYGGNATTEETVERALLWLKKQQQRDGSWSLKGPYSDGASAENRVAATAMALLAFQGAGHTDRSGDHFRAVEKGWRFLLGKMDGDGNFLQEPIPNQHRTYSQAQATIALCELYGMTGDAELRTKAQKAVDFALAWQAPEGGWRYTPKSESDLSASGWWLMALQSARMSGLDVPEENLRSVDRFLDSVASQPDEDQDFLVGSRYKYRVSRAERYSPTMTAEGLLCRQYLGWEQDDPRLVSGMQYLLRHPIRWEEPDVYYWYYGTQVAHHLEGESWDAWNREMRQIIPENQIRGGREVGSWSPAGDRNGVIGGRLFMTCLCTYMLEVYYRHLPIYSKQYLIGK